MELRKCDKWPPPPSHIVSSRPISQTSHNAPFCNSNFSYKTVHCGIWDSCLMRFMKRYNWKLLTLTFGLQIIQGMYDTPFTVHWYNISVTLQDIGLLCLLFSMVLISPRPADKLLFFLDIYFAKPRQTVFEKGELFSTDYWFVMFYFRRLTMLAATVCTKTGTNASSRRDNSLHLTNWDNTGCSKFKHFSSQNIGWVFDIVSIQTKPRVELSPNELDSLSASIAVLHVYCVDNKIALQWRHNEHDGVSNHQRLYNLLNCWFKHRSKKTSTLRVTGLCAGNSPVTRTKASSAENIIIWWRHHVRVKNLINNPAIN